MKVQLKAVAESLQHDSNRLDHHARKLREISPDLEAQAEEVDDRVKSIRRQIKILEKWE